MCLDVLRALKRDEDAVGVFAQLAREAADLVGAEAVGVDPKEFANNEFANEANARITVGKLAILAAAAALKASAPLTVTETFLRTRLVRPSGSLYGADGIDAATAELVLQRALPA
jgi:hypothetical protein